jgi:hypothetical protein
MTLSRWTLSLIVAALLSGCATTSRLDAAGDVHALLVAVRNHDRAGFDAHISDELGSMSLTTRGYAQMTALVKTWAEDLCQGKLILNLEGGYHAPALAQNVFACAQVLAGTFLPEECDWDDVREDLGNWMTEVLK